LTTLHATPVPASSAGRWTRFAWAAVLGIGLLVVALYWRNLAWIWAKTNLFYGQDSGEWAHSTLVPIIGIYYLYLRRDDLRAASIDPVLPASRWPWLLAGGSVVAVVASMAWLFGRTMNPPPSWLSLALPVAAIGFLAAASEVVVTSVRGNVGRPRMMLGGLFLICGIAGWQFFAVVTSLLGPVPSGYVSSACLGVAILGLLVMLFDWGVATLVAGVFLTGYGIWPGQNTFLQMLGMVLAIFGATLTIGGWRIMKIVWFPILFLTFAIPWPSLVYSKVAMPLQYLAAEVAVVVMNLCMIDTSVEGTQIVIHNEMGMPHVLNVAEACAGMRSLMTFLTVGAAIAFIFGPDRPLWQRLVIVVAAVPIAILCNVGRVAGMGVAYVYVSEAVAEGFTHKMAGLVMLVPAFFLLVGVGWVLDNLYVEEDDAATDDATAHGSSAGRLHHA
jgi:exosortase